MNSSSHPTTRTSLSAVISLVFGIMSPVVLVMIVPAVITSSLAIGLGHVALVKIGRSQGSVLGWRRAIAGLILGYLVLPLSLWWTPGFLFNFPDPTLMAVEHLAFSDAERIITNSSGGNSPAATKLAQVFSRDFGGGVNSLIVQKTRFGGEYELSDHFNVYCQLSPNRICFLVKVPGYNRYEDDAHNAIAEVAWRSGVKTAAAANLPSGSSLAVGLKGRILFGSVLIGDADRDQPRERNAKSERLVSYFK